MGTLFRKTLISCALAALSTVALSATVTDTVQKQPENIFYRSGAEGWYWYHDPVVEEPQPEPEPQPIVAQHEPKPQDTEPPKPAPFTLQWVQEAIPKYRELAWNNPTPENVQAFFLIQRFAMDRANKFADVAQQVVVGNTLLDETMRRPLASFATTYVDRASASNADDLLRKIAQKAGIFFFFRSDCRFCEAQAPLLAFMEQYGFDVLAVSIDGGQLQSHQFKNTKIDGGQAELLGVQSTPAIYLMAEDGHFSPISQTVVSFSELRRRFLLVANREGWITDEEFKDTQPYLNPNDQHDLSEELPKLIQASAGDPSVLFGSPEQSEKVAKMNADEAHTLADETNFIEPKKLIALFGRAAQTHGNVNDAEGNDENENN